MKHWSVFGSLMLATGILGEARSVQAAPYVDLKVLLIATGSRANDPGRAVMETLMDTIGVPYRTLDASVETLTSTLLYARSDWGRYNGVILTNSETYLPTGGVGLNATEFALLQEYERKFGVREAVMSGFPATSATVDYGMGSVSSGSNLSGRWVGAAGGKEVFEYVNPGAPLATEGFAFLGKARDAAGTGPTVEPLLVDSRDASYALVSRLRYPNGRQVLLSTLNQASWNLHTSVLAYEFLNFATSGLFLGARRAYLALHNDDLFLPDEVWNPATNSNWVEEERSFRLSADEVVDAVEAQVRFRNAHPLAGAFRTDWAFNGVGANLATDPLTQNISRYGGEFGFINHTYQALQMDRLCPDPESPVGCVVTDYNTALAEMRDNATVWSQVKLPNPTLALRAVLSDAHSGLEDRKGTPSRDDDTPFPQGFNRNFGSAAQALGVRTLAGDASRINQDKIQRIPGFNLMLLPRYPTAVFYNTTTPEELTSEYNYLFHGRFLAAGQDPCTTPGALCQPRSYDEILDSEAVTTLRHILSFEPFPHYMHQVNLHTYDTLGHTLQFDWLEAVLTSYESVVKLPLRNLRFHELGDLAWQRVLAKEASPVATLDLGLKTVSVRASRTATVEVTGVRGTETYGGQSIARVTATTVARSYPLDAALDR